MKKTAFDIFLGNPEVVHFTEGNHVVSREHHSESEALALFQRDLVDSKITREDLQARWVQYHIGESDDEFDGGGAWWIKQSPGKNRKKVWVIGE